MPEDEEGQQPGADNGFAYQDEAQFDEPLGHEEEQPAAEPEARAEERTPAREEAPARQSTAWGPLFTEDEDRYLDELALTNPRQAARIEATRVQQRADQVRAAEDEMLAEIDDRKLRAAARKHLAGMAPQYRGSAQAVEAAKNMAFTERLTNSKPTDKIALLEAEIARLRGTSTPARRAGPDDRNPEPERREPTPPAQRMSPGGSVSPRAHGGRVLQTANRRNDGDAFDDLQERFGGEAGAYRENSRG